MPKQPVDDYCCEIEAQRRVWPRKPSLQTLYRCWYARIVGHLSPLRPLVEIGSGCGNFKAFFPETVATDVYSSGPWIDRVVDASRLPFSPGEVGNFVLIDCLHHLPRPLEFLRAASQALKPGGRIILFEPAATPWARFVWKHFHHEAVDLTQDFFAEDGLPQPENKGFTYSNMATATALFVHGRDRLPGTMPDLSLVRVELSDFLVYPATGGFSYHNFVPAKLVALLYGIESLVMRPFARGLTGLRMLVVLERSAR